MGALQAEQNAKAAQTQAASQRAKDDYRAGEKAYDIAQASTQNTGSGKPLAMPVPAENRVTDKEREEAMTAYREGERNAVSIAEEYKSQVREEANLSHREGERDAMDTVREYAAQSYREGEREAESIAEQARQNVVESARWAGVASVAQAQPEEQKPWWEKALAYQYTPVVTGAVAVLTTDASYLLLLTSASPIAPVTVPLAYICMGISKIASIASVISTGYQYNHDLYGTTKTDTAVAIATYGSSFIPGMEIMNHLGFLYSCYTTFWR